MTTDAERREATDQWTIQTREQQLRDLRAQLATANEARQQLQDALHVRDTQLAAVTADKAALMKTLHEYAQSVERMKEKIAAATERAEAAESALRLATNTDELRRLMIDTDVILIGLDPKDIKGAINWGDLGAREVTRVYDADHRSWLRMVIEEVSPGEEQLIAAVRARLATKGWDVSNIEIETDW